MMCGHGHRRITVRGLGLSRESVRTDHPPSDEPAATTGRPGPALVVYLQCMRRTGE